MTYMMSAVRDPPAVIWSKNKCMDGYPNGSIDEAIGRKRVMAGLEIISE